MRAVKVANAGLQGSSALTDAVVLVAFFLYYIIGVAYYSTVEGWSYTDSIYFITVSVSTVGYGQFVPSTDAARTFTVFFVLPGIYMMFTLSKAMAKRWLVHLQSRALDCVHGNNRWAPRAKLYFSAVCVATILLIGLLSFAVLEDWSAAKSFYWTFQTMSTVGYGDLDVKNESTRKFGIFFIFLCVLAFALVMDNVETVSLGTREDEVGLVSGAGSSSSSTSNSSSGGPAKDTIPAAGDGEIDAALAFCVRKGLISTTDAEAAKEYARRHHHSAAAKGNFDESTIEMTDSRI